VVLGAYLRDHSPLNRLCRPYYYLLGISQTS